MKIISKPSPNFELKAKRRIKYIIIHYTNLPSTQASLKHILNKRNKVSAHYLLDQKGKIYALVNEKDIAWHAGISSWKADKLLNKKSIGIELQNTGTAGNYEKFPNQQISQLEKLILELQNKYNISNANILGHSDISPDRKIDPGPKFPWQRLFKNGIGLMPKIYPTKSKKNTTSNEIKNLQILLKKFGYNLKVNGFMDKQTLLVLYAFQSHYCPNELSVPGNNLNLPRYLKELIKLQSQ
ncbi:N-acetylmuramoyl-L-alanine amidase [Pelagibacteraceae bacterium]|nr:N-acetylmuramoyl-L-alanine amidase [Pelagibacteraceae bacterium]